MSCLKNDYVNKYNITINECKEIGPYSCIAGTFWTEMLHNCVNIGGIIIYVVSKEGFEIAKHNDLWNIL